MSIIGFSQQDDRTAAVVVDTLDNHARHMSKMMVLPHLGAVIAGRGRSDVFQCIVAHMLACNDFDGAADRLESIFGEVLRDVPAYDAALAAANGLTVAEMHDQRLGNAEHPSAQDILLVGHSARSGIIEATHIHRLAADQPTKVLRRAGCVIAPPSDALIPKADQLLETNEGALEFVRTLYLSQDLKAGYGGRAIVARVSAAQVVIQDLGTL